MEANPHFFAGVVVLVGGERSPKPVGILGPICVQPGCWDYPNCAESYLPDLQVMLEKQDFWPVGLFLVHQTPDRGYVGEMFKLRTEREVEPWVVETRLTLPPAG